MANLNGDIKKLKLGELFGKIATGFCTAVLIYFIVCFTLARVEGYKTLELITLISAPVLMVAGIAVAAFCNLKYGGAIDRAVNNYVRDVCIENAPLMHPERNSLTFYIAVEDMQVVLQVNGYKEKIVFDFSAFGNLPTTRKIAVASAIENRLIITFCRLYDRGATYTDVSYVERDISRRKSGKPVDIIKDGSPDKRSYKFYLKNR